MGDPLHSDGGSADLSEEQVSVLREIFDRFDKDGDGRVTEVEIAAMLRSLGLGALEAAEMEALCCCSAEDEAQEEPRFVRFDRFVEVVGPAMLAAPACYGEEELVALFGAFDRDGNGYITAAELAHSMAKLGHPLSPRELADMIRDADSDGDGRISYDEFVAALTAGGGCGLQEEERL